VPVISDTLIAEIENAPAPVRSILEYLLAVDHERLPITEEVVGLQQAYLAAGVVTARFADDALHVAQATVARADVIASWNFKHLVNPIRVRAFNDVNSSRGYGVVVILTPADVRQYIAGR